MDNQWILDILNSIGQQAADQLHAMADRDDRDPVSTAYWNGQSDAAGGAAIKIEARLKGEA